MHDPALKICPKCKSNMSLGFASHVYPLVFVAPSKLAKAIARIRPLGKRSLWAKLFNVSGTYNPAYVCEKCGIFLTEYNRKLSRVEARQLAISMMDVEKPNGAELEEA